MQKLKKYYPYLILFVLAVTAFFQVSFFIHPVKFDAIDCFYPWRFHIGECLQNGQLPYWNPFQDLGYPIHADPSSGAWYPMVWLIGFFNGYTVYTIGFEFWVHCFLAGVGMYTLARTLKFEMKFALLAGIAYMLSGFFIGNAQHLPYIISACWLPYVLNYYFKLMEERSTLNSLKAALFLFLMITGGYPAITIILFYLMLIFFSVRVFKLIKLKERKELQFFIVQNFLLLVYTILFSLVLLVAIYQVSPYLSRLGNFDLQQALFSPLSPKSFISFILPFATSTHTPIFNSDPSMRNAYFGLFIFVFFSLGVFIKKPWHIKILFYFGLFSLTAALGEYLPVREFLFKYVPMMNVFRFPSVFRLFFILPAILTGIYYLQTVFTKEDWKKNTLLRGLIPLILVLIGLLFIAFVFKQPDLTNFLKQHLFVANETAQLWEYIAFQAIVQLIFASLLLILILKLNDKKKIFVSIFVLTVVDLFFATQLNAPYCVYYDKVDAKSAALNVSRYQKGFPHQQNISIDSAAHLPGIGQPFWQNQTTFQKQISAEGFNSFSFSSYEFLESEYPQLFSELKKNKLIVLSDTILNETEMGQYKKDSLFKATNLFLDSNAFTSLSKRSFSISPGDTAYLHSYDAAHFTIKSSLSNRCLLTLYQKEYKGWSAKVNGVKAHIYKSNLNFMTIMVGPGKSKIVFEYKNPTLKIAFYISVFFLIMALGVIGIDSFRSFRAKQ